MPHSIVSFEEIERVAMRAAERGDPADLACAYPADSEAGQRFATAHARHTASMKALGLAPEKALQ